MMSFISCVASVSARSLHISIFEEYAEPVFVIEQIHDEAKKFAYQTGIRVVVAYGGAPVHNQVWV